MTDAGSFTWKFQYDVYKENFEFYFCHNSYVNFVVVPYMFFMNFDRYIQSEIFTAFTFNGNEDI